MIYVVRHGETDLNKERKMQGREGRPLNRRGIEQAEMLKEELKNVRFDLVFSSPQERAIQTAEIITGLKAVLVENLNVFDLGEADGLLVNEVQMAGTLPDRTAYKGIEDPECFVKRVFRFMTELESLYGDNRFNILIAGHRCTTGAVGAYFEGIPADRNILKFSSNTGAYKTFTFKNAH